MSLGVVVGAVGIFLHYRGNVEFELEHDRVTATARGVRLLIGRSPASAASTYPSLFEPLPVH
jgi:hypothetical protein